MWKRKRDRRAEREAMRARRQERIHRGRLETADLRAQQRVMQNDPECVRELQLMMRICTLVGRAALPLSTIPAEKHPSIMKVFDDYDRASVMMVFSKKFPMTHAFDTQYDLLYRTSGVLAADESKIVAKALIVLNDAGMILRPYWYDPSGSGTRAFYIRELLAWYRTNFGPDGVATALDIAPGDLLSALSEHALRRREWRGP